METVLCIVDIVALFLMGLIVYWLLKKRIDAMHEEAHQEIMYFNLCNKRRFEFLENCFKTGKVLKKPKEWLSDDEKKLFSKLLESKIELLQEDVVGE